MCFLHGDSENRPKDWPADPRTSLALYLVARSIYRVTLDMAPPQAVAECSDVLRQVAGDDSDQRLLGMAMDVAATAVREHAGAFELEVLHMLDIRAQRGGDGSRLEQLLLDAVLEGGLPGWLRPEGRRFIEESGIPGCGSVRPAAVAAAI